MQRKITAHYDIPLLYIDLALHADTDKARKGLSSGEKDP